MLRKVASRTIGVDAYYEILEEGVDYDELAIKIVKNEHRIFHPYMIANKTFKFEFESWGMHYTYQQKLGLHFHLECYHMKKFPKKKQIPDMLRQFGTIQLWNHLKLDANNPEFRFAIIFDSVVRNKSDKVKKIELKKVYLTRWVNPH